jgi:phospholipid/cholesterol/gamma-HCH transport system substrate-binding protein
MRLGVVTVVVMLLVMAAAFNLSKFPGFRGQTYSAQFADASGLRVGNMVQIAGIRAGRVDKIRLEGNKVLVEFHVDHGYELGTRSGAAVQVLNLLGEKYLELTPAGPGELDPDRPIPLSRTQSAYDIVGVLGDLSRTTEQIDTHRLGQALDTLSSTLNGSSREVRASFSGISRLSRTVASRDAALQQLLDRSHSVSRLLSARKNDLVTLMHSGDLVLRELRMRKRAIHALLVNARTLAVQLQGVADDNRVQLGPALHQVRQVLRLLQDKQTELRKTIAALGPYADILGNIVGTGPWFDGYVVNLGGLAGEFVPNNRGHI